MPSLIALLLCILFIFFLFVLDSKQKSNVSSAIWVPIIWITIMGSRLVAQWMNPGYLSTEADYMTGNPLDRTIFVILIIAGIIILSRRKIYWSQLVKRNIWIFLLVWYGGISILWSDFPDIAFKRWFKAIGDPIMALIVLTEDDPVEAVKTVIRKCAYLLVTLSILLIKYYPDLGKIYTPWGGSELVGVSTSKNMLGKLCLVCGLYFFWSVITIKRKKNLSTNKIKIIVNILLLLMTLWLLIKSNSITSLVSFIFGISILIGLSGLKNNVRYVSIIILHISAILLVLQLSGAIEIFTEKVGRDMTFTGRTDIWLEVIKTDINPIIGSGYESFWLGERLTELWSNHWWRPNQAHNGYIEIYLNLGLIGLFLLITVLVNAYKKIYNTMLFDFNYGRFGMTFLVVLLVYNITEAAFKVPDITWLIFLFIAMDVPHSSIIGTQ